MNSPLPRSPWRRPLLLFLLSVTPGLLSPEPARSQEAVDPILRGQVRRGGAPLGEGVVVLHQVSAESSGEIDSVRVAGDGSFQLRLPHVPDHATRPEIFFAAIEHQGLLYFGPAITEAVQLDSLYLIQAYDTLAVPSGGVELPLTVRNLFLEKTAEGWAATDLIEVRQDGERTLFSPQEGVIWRYPLPPSARDFQAGQADMEPDAVRFTEGWMEVYTPLPPGERYFLVRYTIPQDDFSVPLPGQTDLLEVMVREPGPPVEFPPLRPAEAVELEPGNVYRRFAAENLRDALVQASVAPEPFELPAEWLGIFLAALLGAAGVYGYRRRQSGNEGQGVASRPGAAREELLLAVAELDEAFAAVGDPSHAARRRYERRREKLLAGLKKPN